MVSPMYAIYDRAAKEFGPLFQSVNNEVAVRQFRATTRDVAPEYRDDFELWCMATYDSSTGEVAQLEAGRFKITVRVEKKPEQKELMG